MGGAAQRRGRGWCASALLLLLGPAAAPVAPAAEEPPPAVDTGERVRHPVTGAEFRVLRRALGGRKEIEGPDGTRFDSVDAAFLAEEAGVRPDRRALDASLWAAAEDPARAAEPIRVALILLRQPVRDASQALRPQLREEMGARLGALRRILGRIAERRAADPERRMRLRDRMEEEAALLTPFERDEVARIRAEVLAASRAARASILAAARPIAEADHAEVSAALARIEGARVLGTSLALNTVSAEVPAGRLLGLVDEVPGIARVMPVGESSLSTDTSVPAVGAGSWSGAGSGGSGVRVGVLDTGIDGAHPALDGSVVAGKAFPENDSNGMPFGTDDDWLGHGTHVAGIVASRDSTYGGMAPGASLVNARCFLGVSAFSYWIWRAADYAVNEQSDVLNCSFGSPGTTDGSFQDSIFFDAIAADLGVSVACAAGNSSAAGQYNRPGDGFNVLGVANFWDKGTVSGSDDVLSGVSSPGLTSDGRRKPDLAAPGTDIDACAYDWEGSNPDFVTKTGTSMATPHAAGALALLAGDAASWSPDGMRALLLANLRIASPVPAPHDPGWGWGALDLASAWTNRGSVFEGVFTDGGDDVAWLTAPSMAAGQRVFLCWSRDASYTSGTYFMSSRTPVDLDITVYDSATGAFLGESAKALDSVEGVFLSAGSSAPLIKIKRSGAFPSGQTSVDWAIALDAASAPTAAEGPSIPSAPSISIAFDSELLRIGEETAVRATIRNEGGLAIPAGLATLEIPPGIQFAGALAEASLAIDSPSVGPGGEAEVSWTVKRLPGPGGTLTFRARTDVVAFGEDLTTGWQTAEIEADRAPWGTVTIADGVEVTRESPVPVAITVLYADGPVPDMRVRQPGEEWGAFAAFSPYSLHEIGTGVGERILEVQLRDAAGRISIALTDSVFLDADAPSASLSLSGGAAYLMPWHALTADVAVDDGPGSGLESLRVRWNGTGGPSAWIPLPGDASGSYPLERPGGEDARAEAQAFDRAGNLSGLAGDRIRLVAADAPDLTSVKTLSGVLGPDGDIDGYRILLFPGDELTVRAKAKRTRGVPDVPLAVDLFDASGAQVATGRFPADAPQAGIRGFWTADGGVHWIVVRAEGAVPEAGAAYSLSIRAKRLRESTKVVRLEFGSGGVIEVPFRAMDGAVLTGWLEGVTGPPLLRSPDGSVRPLSGAPDGLDRWRVGRMKLEGGSGIYTLVVPADPAVVCYLRFAPPRPGRFEATEE